MLIIGMIILIIVMFIVGSVYIYRSETIGVVRMKKFIKIIILVFLMMFILTGCNKQIIDTSFTYNKAIINTGNEILTIKIKKWNDYEGEQIQIVSEDGTVYLVSSYNTVLIKEK